MKEALKACGIDGKFWSHCRCVILELWQRPLIFFGGKRYWIKEVFENSYSVI